MIVASDTEENRGFKDDLYRAFSRIGKALSGPKRLEMLDLLAQKERNVQELADAMGISITNASQHLQTLQEARLVERRSEGNYRFYRLADEDVFDLWRALRDLARQRLPEVDEIVERHLGRRGQASTPGPAELATLREDGSLLLDVRPEDEYHEAHLEGAVSIPIDEIEERTDELPDDEEILVYCRGPFCVYSDRAVDVLRERGLEARRLDPGLPDWRTMGAPVTDAGEGRA